ncbi:MAG TPA: ribonuclease R, partial [Alphaproteobacteria bacterium]|nr:ribonuclease R [Alphaproteobacteria bacterium]
VGVTRFGLFMSLIETGAQGLVPVSTLGTERFHHDERHHLLEGLRTGTVYRLGDRLEVTIREASPVTGGLLLGLADGADQGRAYGGHAARAPRPPAATRRARAPHRRKRR